MVKDIDFILKHASEKQVKFIRLWFTDILGFLKSFSITISELEDALLEGVRFDGSTLQGYVRSDEREMIAFPDPSTFRILPWRPQEDAVARMFCDIHLVDMTPFEGDPRYILKKNLEKASEKGLTFYTGPEIEFFFFKNSSCPEILDKGGYFDLTPLDLASDYRRQTVLTLEKMGIDVLSSHHEVSYSQHEIDLRHSDALSTADNIMTFKLIAKEIGQINNIYASFMPKPMADQNGSGLHIHQSLFDGDRNIFFDSSKKNHISETCERFIAGLLTHSHEYIAITNQWVNSYKRLIQGFESPTHIAWSTNSPKTMIRVPQCKPGKPESMRIELRNPDPACNPYLAFSVMLASGLKGIEEKYKLPEPMDIHDTHDHEISKKFSKITTDINRSIDNFEKSELMKETLGSYIHKKFIENKIYEMDRYNSFITDFEINEYLPKL